MSPAFVTGALLPLRSAHKQGQVCTRMAVDGNAVVDKYYPLYRRYRAPTIVVDGEKGISVSMAPIVAFEETDKTDAPLFDYNGGEFIANKPVPPSSISWPSGDGRGVAMGGTAGSFTQPNLKDYGPFPDFFKVSFDWIVSLKGVRSEANMIFSM